MRLETSPTRFVFSSQTSPSYPGRLCTRVADAVGAEFKNLQTLVHFKPLSQGLAVPGRKHRDGLPFFYAQGIGTDLVKSRGGAGPKSTSSGWESPGGRLTITFRYVN